MLQLSYLPIRQWKWKAKVSTISVFNHHQCFNPPKIMRVKHEPVMALQCMEHVTNMHPVCSIKLSQWNGKPNLIRLVIYPKSFLISRVDWKDHKHEGNTCIMNVHGDHVLFYVKEVPGPPGKNCLCGEADSKIACGNQKPIGNTRQHLLYPWVPLGHLWGIGLL